MAATQDVLSAALAAGLPLPHSCRAGRCASCKSRLISGHVEYPAGRPPGITAVEVARGEVLLCQARPRSDLVIEARRRPVSPEDGTPAELVALEALPLGAWCLRLRSRRPLATPLARPGQFLDVSGPFDGVERLAVIASDADTLGLECPDDSSALRRWLDSGPPLGAELRLGGPHDRPR